MSANIRSETDIWILLYYIGEIICVFILLSQIVGICYNSSRLQALNHKSWVSKQGATNKILTSLFTTYTCSIIGIAIVISRIGNHLYDPILCQYTYMISFMLFATAKICNYYFFLQRAKLAQGLNKLLPEIAFEHIFPILFILMYILYIIMIILLPLNGTKKISANTGRILCVWDAPDIEHEIIFFISTIFDISMTIFFLYLYGKPMCDIVRHSNEQRSHMATSTSIKTHEIKLRRCIIVNFICSSISTIHTGIIALTWWNISFMSWWIIMDYVVNCLCLFGMFASNRRLLLHCCCCHHKCVENTINYNIQINKEQDNNHGRSDTMNSDTGSNNKLGLEIQRNSHTSLNTMSDFPQPQNVLNSKDESKASHIISPSISAISVIEMSSNNKKDQDIAERNGYISTENGINYIKYLDPSSNDCSCWHYKSKLFWTWFTYFFCFCGNGSVCKCYICLCKISICKKRMQSRKHVMNFMFSAAKKIQYIRYYQRYHAQTFNFVLNHETIKKQQKKKTVSLQSINEIHDKPESSVDDADNNTLDGGISEFTVHSY